MKKTTISVILLSLCVLFIGGFYFKGNFGRSFHHSLTKSCDLSQAAIDDVNLNDIIKSEKITSKYGEISELSQDNEFYYYYFLRDGIEIATEKDKYNIIRIIVTDENIKNNRGICIGDSTEKVIDTYGENYYKRIEQGVDIIGYIDKVNDCSIEFWIGQDKVEMMRLDYNYMA